MSRDETLYPSGAQMMTEARAREVLAGWISADGGLFRLSAYLGWTPGAAVAVLDGEFTADQLEAVAWWMRNVRITLIEAA